ncbi:MAG: quinone-dependent dihydroorotate dehydrogenase [Akkermansia sp.]|nr:quinone-dependent dihydroorotate dehydrogenase [Akkermansia sp.]
MSPKLYSLAKSCLFKFNPETAHNMTLFGLRMAEKLRVLPMMMGDVPSDPVEILGMKFPNRVGLAAGMDKEADTINAFGQVGFGFVEVGTLTPRPQPGNDKPRLFRLIPHRAIINRMGFNNHGIYQGVENIRKATRFNGVLGVNIGKNKVTPNEDAVHDYLTCLKAAWDVADYIAINFSSPNTPGLRDLQAAEPAARLLASLKAEQANLEKESGVYKPIFMKVAPDVTEEHISELSRVFVEEGLDGLIVTNTTLSRVGVESHPHGNEAGGLSGAPLTTRSTEVIRAFASELQGRIPIIGVGGIMCGADAVEKIKAGASLVQLYTGFIYRGPELIRECVEAMKAECPVQK